MKYFLIVLFTIFTISNARADETTCAVLSTTYSCVAGYYMLGTSCIRCPAVGWATSLGGSYLYGTSPDYNIGDITSCYAAEGTYYDSTGEFILEQGLKEINCFYTE